MLIVLVVLITFGNSLRNDFVGDDFVVVVENPFYATLKNVPLLFSPDYSTVSDKVFNNVNDHYLSSGSVAYRPVLSLSYFLDRFSWKLNPLGYHLTNLLLHLANAILVYGVIFCIFKEVPLTLLTAAFFAVHPLKTEAVCSVGYRADMLAGIFALGSFLCFVQALQNNLQKRLRLSFSYLFYFFAVFSKESAIVIPGLCVLYEVILRRQGSQSEKYFSVSKYLGFVVVFLFYGFMYFIVFPNTALSQSALSFLPVLTRLVTVMWIYAQYLLLFFFPFTVKVLPPVYLPSISGVFGPELWISLCLIMLTAGVSFWLNRKRPMVSFFLFWFLACLVPVINIIPLANPMAYRFMYLPSFGLAFLVAYALTHGLAKILAPGQRRLGQIIQAVLVIFCMLLTFGNNTAWKNNFVISSNMIKDFPQDPAGYLIKGLEYFKRRQPLEAREMLQRSISLGIMDPRAYYLMGLSLSAEPQKAIKYFEYSIQQFPFYGLSYVGLGKLHLFLGNDDEAMRYLIKGNELTKSYSSYAYLIQYYLKQGSREKAMRLLTDARQAGPDERFLESLENFFKDDVSRFPIDVGI